MIIIDKIIKITRIPISTIIIDNIITIIKIIIIQTIKDKIIITNKTIIKTKITKTTISTTEKPKITANKTNFNIINKMAKVYIWTTRPIFYSRVFLKKTKNYFLNLFLKNNQNKTKV